MRRIYLLIMLSLIAITTIVATVCLAANETVESVLLSVGDCKILKITNFNRVATSSPDVVEVVVTSTQEIILNAKKPGMAAVNVWSPEGLFTFRISVQEDYSGIERELQQLIKNPGVQVIVNAKYVILKGAVETSLDSEEAEQYAKMYRDSVINNIIVKTKTQVLLQVAVTEMKVEEEKKYGLRWGSWIKTQQGMQFNDWNWSIIESGYPNGPTGQGIGRFADNWFIGTMLDEMQKNGDAKILSMPSVLTLNGKEANFMAGGEIPIPLSDGQGGVKVEWKEYGVKLKVTATIARDDSVTLAVSPEVSSLDWANAVSVGTGKLPALSTRKATTNVRFQSGSTLVIGGLLKREDSQTIFKLPILGDLPIIGPLFRSNGFQKGDTELLFFVTPKIVRDEKDVSPESVVKPENQGPYFKSGPIPPTETPKNK